MTDEPKAVPQVREGEGVFIPFGTSLKEASDFLFNATLAKCAGNKTHAAKMLGVTRASIYSRLAGKKAQSSSGD